MSFWSDASPIVKIAIVIGAVGFLYLGIAKVAHWAPFPADEPAAQARGL